LQVYPAAGLLAETRKDVPIYFIDPNAKDVRQRSNMTLISENASTGVRKLKDLLMNL
jgi:NAD-dependent deacetylase